MSKGILYDGFPSKEELESAPGVPSMKDLNKKPLAVLECFQCIPCNPCESACPFDAITIDGCISNRPRLDPEKCRACGSCLASCPGLAIFLVNMNFSNTTALVTIPYELSPLPEEGTVVACVNRCGDVITEGRVHKVQSSEAFNNTHLISLEVNKKFAMDVRHIRM